MSPNLSILSRPGKPRITEEWIIISGLTVYQSSLVKTANNKTECNPWRPVKTIKIVSSAQPRYSRTREYSHYGLALSRG